MGLTKGKEDKHKRIERGSSYEGIPVITVHDSKYRGNVYKNSSCTLTEYNTPAHTCKVFGEELTPLVNGHTLLVKFVMNEASVEFELKSNC